MSASLPPPNNSAASTPPPGSPPPPHRNPVKVVLLVAAVFALLCTGLCVGLMTWALNTHTVPTAEELASLPPLQPSPQDIENALPFLAAADRSSVRILNRRRDSLGPVAAGQSRVTVFCDSLDNRLRRVVIEAAMPPNSNTASRATAEQAALAVLQLLDPAGAPTAATFTHFCGQTAAQQDFGAARCVLATSLDRDSSQTVRFTLSGVPPPTGATPASPTNPAAQEGSAPATATSAATAPAPLPADVAAYAPWVARLVAEVPVLANPPPVLAGAGADRHLEWTAVKVGGKPHRVVARGAGAAQPTEIVVTTHYRRTGWTDDHRESDVSGIALTALLLQWLDPHMDPAAPKTIAGDVYQALRPSESSLDYARLDTERYGPVNVVMHYLGEDPDGNRLEFRLTPR